MPLPTGRQVHVDVPLTNVSIAYAVRNTGAQFGYVADSVFPVVPVTHKSNIYYTYNKGDWFRGGSKPRGPATESAGTGFRMGTDSYLCKVWALHDDVAWQDEANSDPNIDLRSDAAEFLTQNMLIDREVDWVNNYMVPGVWANNWVGNTAFPRWDDYVNSNPAEDIEEAKLLIEKTTGFAPNKLVVGRRVHSRLKFHPLVKDQYKHTTADSITAAMLAKVFEIENYMVAGGVKNNGVEGGADNFDFIHGDSFLLCYAAPSPSLRRPSAGYTFSWTGYLGASAAAPQINRFDMEALKATRVEGEMAYVHKRVAADMAVFASSVVSP